MTDPSGMTPLDRAHAEMTAAPDDDTARLAFYERFAECELFLLLANESDGPSVTPEVFDLGDAAYVLVFDREERLAGFAGRQAAYAALSGRAIAEMLAGRPLGVGLNLDVAPSSILLPAHALGWLHATLGNLPSETAGRITELHPPGDLPERLLTAIDGKLATAAGLAEAAWLVGVSYDDGSRGHLLGFVGAVPAAQSALAKAAAEALTFSGIEAGSMDVAFLGAKDPKIAKIARVGLRFDLPKLQQMRDPSRPAPGMDPENPPKLT